MPFTGLQIIYDLMFDGPSNSYDVVHASKSNWESEPMLEVMIHLVAISAGLSAPQAGECRSIADPAARLACYDEREAPRPAARIPTAPTAAARPARQPVPTTAGTSRADSVRADAEGRVVAVARRRYGLFRLTLDDGRAYDTTTNTQAPPAVGAAIRLRRTPLGTTFLDTRGRDPITVRRVRPDR